MFFPGSPLNYPVTKFGTLRLYKQNRAPTDFDIENFELGDEWLDLSANDWWKLVSKDPNVSPHWVLLASTPGTMVDIEVDDFTPPGTDPVIPNGAGTVIFTGAQVASGVVGTNVIRTDSLAANTVTWEIQRTDAVAAPNLDINGVSHFNSAHFTVDADGFVSLAGGGLAIDSINVDASTPPGTDPVIPDAGGSVTFTGAQVASGTVGSNVIRTDSLAANSITWEIQRSTDNATPDPDLNGVSHFDSTFFSVDTDGFVSFVGGVGAETITGDTGGALSPTAGNWNIVGQTTPNTSGIQTNGSMSTLDLRMFSPFTLSDFAFQSTTSGTTRNLIVENTSNTASSAANMISRVGGATAADPTYQSIVEGVTTWTWGTDNSETSPGVDPWKLSASASLGTTDVMVSQKTGVITFPLQPSFLAIAALQNNVTGDGTTYTAQFTTVIINRNSFFDGTSTCTAPVTGVYNFQAILVITGITANNTAGRHQLVASNRSLRMSNLNPFTVQQVNGTSSCGLNGGTLVDMDLADTATITIVVSEIDKGINIATVSYFSGNLVC